METQKIAAPAERLRVAQIVRRNAQRVRALAAERAERLELQLKESAYASVKADIARSIDARSRLRAAKRAAVLRMFAAGVLGLTLGTATSGIAWMTASGPATGTAVAAPVLVAAPGDGLRLALSYDVSPSTR